MYYTKLKNTYQYNNFLKKIHTHYKQRPILQEGYEIAVTAIKHILPTSRSHLPQVDSRHRWRFACIRSVLALYPADILVEKTFHSPPPSSTNLVYVQFCAIPTIIDPRQFYRGRGCRFLGTI